MLSITKHISNERLVCETDEKIQTNFSFCDVLTVIRSNFCIFASICQLHRYQIASKPLYHYCCVYLEQEFQTFIFKASVTYTILLLNVNVLSILKISSLEISGH